jgi:hypothetical protein
MGLCGIGVGWDGGGSVLRDTMMFLSGCSQLLDESEWEFERLFEVVFDLFV